MTDENILKLPVKTRNPVSDPFLVAVPYSQCRHEYGPFEIDERSGKCKCKKCGGDVTPIFVLSELLKIDSLWQRRSETFQDEMKRLSERSRCKCQHCGKMTRISSR
jgi:Zn finger protein HypA/HybF involved in hydrogenase expression